MSIQICKNVIQEILEKEKVLVYCAKIPEVETCWLIDYLLSAKISVIVPIIEKKTLSLRLSYIFSQNVLVPSTFQVPEPINNEIIANSRDLTTIILPVLGFDNKGGRIGYGAGYYDRFLSLNTHIRKIGIAYSCQEISNVPMQDHDISMDMIITEKTIFRCNQ
jgi:5-formyltetrahydrofolate cyclo-ligase